MARVALVTGGTRGIGAAIARAQTAAPDLASLERGCSGGNASNCFSFGKALQKQADDARAAFVWRV